MTYEEVSKIPFHFATHVSFDDCHQTTYSDESGRFGYCVSVTRKPDGGFGKTTRSYRIDNKWYNRKAKFIQALKTLSLDPNLQSSQKKQ